MVLEYVITNENEVDTKCLWGVTFQLSTEHTWKLNTLKTHSVELNDMLKPS